MFLWLISVTRKHNVNNLHVTMSEDAKNMWLLKQNVYLNTYRQVSKDAEQQWQNVFLDDTIPDASVSKEVSEKAKQMWLSKQDVYLNYRQVSEDVEQQWSSEQNVYSYDDNSFPERVLHKQDVYINDNRHDSGFQKEEAKQMWLSKQDVFLNGASFAEKMSEYAKQTWLSKQNVYLNYYERRK